MGDGSSSSSSSSTPSSCLYSSSRSTSSIAPLGPTIDKTDNPEPDHNRQKRLGSDRIEGDGWTFGVGSGSSDHPPTHRRPSDRPRRRRRPHAQLQGSASIPVGDHIFPAITTGAQNPPRLGEKLRRRGEPSSQWIWMRTRRIATRNMLGKLRGRLGLIVGKFGWLSRSGGREIEAESRGMEDE